jgi:heptaprenyl diphosphate synthase
MNRTKYVAQYGLLIALALIFSYVEAQIPAFFAVYRMGEKSALTVNLLRILLVSLLFGNGMSLAYSVAGGLLSGLVMILLKKTGKFRIVTVSVAGGVSHNIGQILVAMALLETTSIVWYLLVLWFTGIASGLLIGVLGGELCRRLEKVPLGGT